MKNSEISWTDHTFNPWIGCTKVSPGCDHCYAEEADKHRNYTAEGWGKGKPRKRTTEANWKNPLKWNAEAAKQGVRMRVFCASLADVFDPEVSAQWRADLFDLIEQTPNLDWQLLTKRPNLIKKQLREIGVWERLPLPNVWFGTTTETQKWFDIRWKHLREIPAVVRFISFEPALGPLVLPRGVEGDLHWVIAGGETSKRCDVARAANPDLFRTLHAQCEGINIPYWFKQHGNHILQPNGIQRWTGKGAALYKAEFDKLDGQIIQQLPVIY